MSQTAVALILLAALLSLVQSAWVRVVAHVDLQLMPLRSRRRVHWLLDNTTHVQLAAAVLAGFAAYIQAIAMLS